ncbi:MerR family DNA-binding transcriptional regulator [Nitratireductor luteus]|uniref:MerR family DNA-binding transcriptional regulator n=1 Tax=Nitratireductor luteus TaxID=2976980 RepID=UPI00237CAE87|nr:MerR family DNA-binding transcriptional regulator [Nitratireductor luteus]
MAKRTGCNQEAIRYYENIGLIPAPPRTPFADLRAKIADLKRIESVLAATAAKCMGKGVPECPVLEALA